MSSNISYWASSTSSPHYPELNGDISTEVAIIGGGITGINIAYLLSKQGYKVIVIDADRIGSGVTSNTTAKITLQHDLIYSKLKKDHGLEKSKLYAEANNSALEKYEYIINSEKIECDFKKVDAYIYSVTDEGATDILYEQSAASESGIECDIVFDTELPIEVKSALKYRNQAEFHPLKYLFKLAEIITENNCNIYENTQALDIKNNIIYTDKGNIKADHIVVATHFPFINVPGFYFMKMYQHRSNAIAFKINKPMDGIYVSSEERGFSFRTQPYSDGTLMIMVGADYKTGHHLENISYYDVLSQAAFKLFGNVEVLYQWSTQDCMPVDSIPFIGKYSASTPHMYVATGYSKWGMSSSMAAAILITDMINGQASKFESLFDPSRIDLKASVKEYATLIGETTVNLATTIFKIAKDKLSEIKNGEAGIIDYEAYRVGVYKDLDGKIHAINAVCGHLGCALSWNPDETSWDCPCHGSRFNIHGKIISSPTVKPIHKIEINTSND